jgi:hypothetical protein
MQKQERTEKNIANRATTRSDTNAQHDTVMLYINSFNRQQHQNKRQRKSDYTPADKWESKTSIKLFQPKGKDLPKTSIQRRIEVLSAFIEYPEDNCITFIQLLTTTKLN